MAVSKLHSWFKHFTNQKNKKTFLNQSESARAAGYKPTENNLNCVGYKNYKKLHIKIEKWLDDIGLSDNSLKIKLMELLNCNETKFITIKGKVEEKDLPTNVKIITSSKLIKEFKTGGRYIEYNTLLGINIDAKETQRRTLDMAIKVKAMYAPVKREISGPGGGPIETKKNYSPEKLKEEMIKRGIPLPETE